MIKTKKVLLTLFAGFVLVVSLPLMAAYEAHVINVTAHIENALKVTPSDDLVFGTVFPQEYHEKRIWVTTSKSFCAGDQRRVLNIDYKIVQKPKCVNPAGEYAPVDYATHECPEGYSEMPSLCPYLSKTPVYDDPEPYKDYGVLAFHDPSDPSSIATGTINKDYDLLDEWIIDLPVPCFEGMCAQDYDEFVYGYNPGVNSDDYILPSELESSDFGCDLWIEATAIY
ncbi:hypothetical protein KAT63_02145 [Candidatus Parcubacteria bacterium]|nr:hypothetical protein [Candidatus Parcubacteria bacterium]